MLKRYIGHVSPASIRIAGQDFGVVETGEAIVIPDELADAVAWPEENWEDGAPESKSKKDSDTKKDKGDN